MSKPKKKSFSIYLLKEGKSSLNALTNDHGLIRISGTKLPDGAEFYLNRKNIKAPWWKDYFGIERDLSQALEAGILFLPVDSRCFALTFGHASHKLNPECYEYDFGLRTTLNCVDPEKLKSTDIYKPNSALQQRGQSPIGSDLTFFEFDNDSSILKRLTGKVKPKYVDLFDMTSGATNIQIKSRVKPEELGDLCKYLLNLYESDEYETTFPGIHNISPIKDPMLTKILDNELVNKLKNKDTEVMLTVPEMIDSHHDFQITFLGAGRSNEYDELLIEHYYEYIQTALDTLSVGTFNNHKLRIKNEHDWVEQFPIRRCVVADVEYGNENYHIFAGNWYHVSKDYIQNLEQSLNILFATSDLPNFSESDEGSYNERVANPSAGLICLDRTSISPQANNQVEPCDLYQYNISCPTFYHVKRGTKSASLSHLFNQGYNSIEILRSNDEAVRLFNELISERSVKESPMEDFRSDGRVKLVYAIISRKDHNQQSKALPLFSRISLMRVARQLKIMGISVEVQLIRDVTAISPGKPQKNKKTNQEVS